MATFTFGDDYELAEDSNGDLVIEHTPSGATLRYDSAAGAWTLGNLVADRQATPAGTLWSQPAGDAVGQQLALSVGETASTVTSTTFEQTAHLLGAIDPSRLPDAATLYGNLMFMSGGTVNQPTDVRAEVFDLAQGSFVELPELDVTIAQGDTFGAYQSGWTQISSGSLQSNPFVGWELKARLHDQTTGDETDPYQRRAIGCLFEWRLD